VRKHKCEYVDFFDENQKYHHRDTIRPNCPTLLWIISYQLSKPFTHSLIIISTITKAESHSTRSDISATKAEIAIDRFPHAVLFTAADLIVVTRESVLVSPRRRWTGSVVAIVAAAHGIDDRADAATLILIHLIGMASMGH
jgi:hypothetical protein